MMKAVVPGSAFALVAPASCINPDLTQKGIELLHKRGYRVLFRPDLKKDFQGYGGTVAGRAEALHWAFTCPEADAVLCVRGGYGCIQLLEHLDYELIRRNPKPFIGYSDITSLHMAFIARSGLQTVHGAMLSSDIAYKAPETTELLLQFLMGEREVLAPSFTVLRHGAAEGTLLGGNLSVFMSSIGTPYMPPLDGCILFLEDVGEAAYKVDRMMRTLRHMGVFNRCAALILGDFSEKGDEQSEGSAKTYHSYVQFVIKEVVKGFSFPVISDLPSGHCIPNYPLPLGAKVSLDTRKGAFLLKEKIFA